ncbi:hypothetical protein LIPSTDRAFT_145458 [Lipomyces starkeyi NRRL Y-11557]|uniref:Uncharacterized protein n=1 Tax=Lipomyces starkeyi NRRL Y-11557 TaxID=675824 RepID=A0A1E3Q081_LIPST|nr:hypothetical protein LIPSTDRAFT_145458 [Lipomyces starkeyi NRRL Y-11557]
MRSISLCDGNSSSSVCRILSSLGVLLCTYEGDFTGVHCELVNVTEILKESILTAVLSKRAKRGAVSWILWLHEVLLDSGGRISSVPKDSGVIIFSSPSREETLATRVSSNCSIRPSLPLI